MGYNLPEGNNSFLDNDDAICEHCGHTDDVSNGEYHNHMWYCDNCYKELFKVCSKCNVCVISVDEELCEDCLAEKTYDESALGMFDKLGYTLKPYGDNELHYVESLETVYCNHIVFFLDTKTYDAYMNYASSFCIGVELHKAITQQMKELKWL